MALAGWLLLTFSIDRRGGWRIRPLRRLSATTQAARSGAERAEIGAEANPSTTPVTHRTVYAAPGSFVRRGKAQG